MKKANFLLVILSVSLLTTGIPAFLGERDISSASSRANGISATRSERGGPAAPNRGDMALVLSPVFPADNIWNAPVDNLPLDPQSAAYVSSIGSGAIVHADFGSGTWDGGPIGIPYVLVPGIQPAVAINYTAYGDESDPGPFPIPAGASIEGGGGSDGDRHVLVVDQDHSMIYELYRAFPQADGSWNADSGAKYDLRSNALRPAGWTSADAAGLPIFPGLVRYDEVAAGEIKHAIRFTAPRTRRAYVWPARHFASSSNDAALPPMGQRFRLKASVDIAGYSAPVQVILRAMKKYGIILADNGAAWYISGSPDERWDNTMLHELDAIRGLDFEAVDCSGLMIDPDSGRTGPAPIIILNRTELHFGAADGISTKTQSVIVSNTGAGTLNWTATSDRIWLGVTPASGTGTGALQVSVNPDGLAAGRTAGAYQGTISVSDANASNSPQTITVNLTVYAAGTSAVPFGSFDTPADGTTGVTGAIPVTGWVLDDIEVAKVEIWRLNVAGETPGQWMIGEAVFVEGARSDIEAALPNYPMNFRAGWGYMMLTNMLPGQGNGPFTLYAYATDKEGNRVLLGTKTITCDNAHAVKPFGTIDTPTQGGEASGSSSPNWGWVLTPLNKTVPVDGSTILVYVDGVLIGNLSTPPNFYNAYRPDVSGAFPGLNNTGAPGAGGPVGLYYLNTTGYANGVHTIAWVATDDNGDADGIGSRYFRIVNAGASHRVGDTSFGDMSLVDPFSKRVADLTDLLILPMTFEPLRVRRGFDLKAEPETLIPDRSGVCHITIPEVNRVEISFNSDNPPTPPFRKGRQDLRFVGFMVADGKLRPLPIGSTLDASKVTFSWLPGPGFIGTYDLLFLQTDGLGITRRIPVKITIRPKSEKR